MADYTVEAVGDGAFAVTSPRGDVYIVAMKRVRLGCVRSDDGGPCPSLRFQGWPCKHIRLVQELTGRRGTLSAKAPRPMADMQTMACWAAWNVERVGLGARAFIAGSIRRAVKPTAGDIDLVVLTDRLQLIQPVGWERLSGGQDRVTLLYQGVQVNLMATTPESLGAALLYYTGSKGFNMRQRAHAKARGYLLNERGLWYGTEIIAGRTEEEVFLALGEAFVPPADREVP
jgi:hypothetical protein